MTAAVLDRPQSTFAFQIEKGDKEIMVKREVDGGMETIKLQIPAVISIDLRLNETRSIAYATLLNIVKAKKKQIAKIIPKDLGVEDRKDQSRQCRVFSDLAKLKVDTFKTIRGVS